VKRTRSWRERMKRATRAKRMMPARGAELPRAARERLRGYLTVARFLLLRRGCAGA
jgi:hypothetical protein